MERWSEIDGGETKAEESQMDHRKLLGSCCAMGIQPDNLTPKEAMKIK